MKNSKKLDPVKMATLEHKDGCVWHNSHRDGCNAGCPNPTGMAGRADYSKAEKLAEDGSCLHPDKRSVLGELDPTGGIVPSIPDDVLYGVDF